MAMHSSPIDFATDAHRSLRASRARAGSQEQVLAGLAERQIEGEVSIEAGRMQVREMTIMATPASPRVENTLFMDRDRIVRRLDAYPELNRALRSGDVSTARLLCARLFSLEGQQALAMAVCSKAS